MKKIIAFTFLFFCFISVSAQIKSYSDLTGKWLGKDIQLEFFYGQHVMLTVPGGKLPMADYSANFMNTPILITITINNNGQKMTIRGELVFNTNDNITLKYFDEDGAGAAFEKGRSVTLKKVK